MEKRPKGYVSEFDNSHYRSKFDSRTDLSVKNYDVVNYLQSIAARDARVELNNEHNVLLFLKSWWSKTYNRPLKDPLLESYTLEELLYEFFDKVEREKAAQERIDKENDKIEEQKMQETLAWIEDEEKKENELTKATPAADNIKNKADNKPLDPTKDPNNIAWMEEQLRAAKEIYGDTFGEDIYEEF